MTTTEIHEHPDGVIGRDSEDRLTIAFTRFYPHSVERVWQAITDPAQTCNWIGRLEFEPRVGGKLSMVLDGTRPNDGPLTEGKVLALSPPHLLEYWFHAPDFELVREDHHINRWELADTDGGCTLTFTNTFAPGERARNSIVCGWHEMMEKIDVTIAGGTTDWQNYNRDRLVELYWHYRKKPRAEV